MKIVGIRMKNNQLRFVNEADWVPLKKITSKSTENINLVCVYKYKNKDIPRAVCWKHENGEEKWSVYFVIDVNNPAHIVKLTNFIPTRYLYKVVKAILNSSVCGLWTTVNLQLTPLVDSIAKSIIEKEVK